MKIDTFYAIIVIIIIGVIVNAYVSSEQYYKKFILQPAFERLKHGENYTLNPEMNWEIINMNIDGYINNKKIVFNQPNRNDTSSHRYDTFTNKNALAAFMNDVLVIDIDSNEPLVLTGATGMDDKPMQHYLPKTTVSAKTPHGYHYYFYNDTGAPIPCRVGLMINNKKYPVDLLTGPKQLIFLPPTQIESECYRWINSPFTHRIEPISKHAHILDLFAYTKEFAIPNEPANACVSHSIPNILCIVWDFPIIYQLKYKCTSSPFEQLHSNQHELMYRSNTTYYLFLKHSPMKNYTAHEFVQHVADLIQKHGINGGIVHLGCGSSYKTHDHDNIAQYNSCLVHNYIQHGLPSASLSAEQTLVQTSLFTHRPISIISNNILHETRLDDDDDGNNHIQVVSEDLFLIFMLSNKTRIPCACLVQIMPFNESKENAKYTKLIQYYIRNVLNATHHTANPSKLLTFFNEVPVNYTDPF
jgi:hypothetical protein